jgi:hypothetical protein
MDYKEKAGLIAAKTARDGLLTTFKSYGLDETAVAAAIKDALDGKRHVEVLTPMGWSRSPGQADHKARLSAANMLADILDLKAPVKHDLRVSEGIITPATVSLIEEILADQGLLTIDITPPPPERSISLRPASFLMEDGMPRVIR